MCVVVYGTIDTPRHIAIRMRIVHLSCGISIKHARKTDTHEFIFFTQNSHYIFVFLILKLNYS